MPALKAKPFGEKEVSLCLFPRVNVSAALKGKYTCNPFLCACVWKHKIVTYMYPCAEAIYVM